MQVCPRFPLAEELIASYSTVLGGDLPAYRNHVCRLLNYFQALTGTAGGPPEAVQIAAVFHDLGIWTDGTFDYLDPSARRARTYLAERELGHLEPEVEALIVQHHKLRRYRGDLAARVEPFRRADLIDLSLGTIRFGVPGEFVKSVKAAFPNHGFHRLLASLTARQLLRTPLRPLPMLRW